MAESLEETLMSGPQPVQTVQSPAQLTNKRIQALKAIQDVFVVMGCGAGAVWSGMILLRLSASKRNSSSTSLVEESFLLCGAQAGDVGSQKPFWLQMLGTVTTNVILHFTMGVKSLDKPVGMLDLATTFPITMALAYTTCANIYHGGYFFLVWWSVTVAILLVGRCLVLGCTGYASLREYRFVKEHLMLLLPFGGIAVLLIIVIICTASLLSVHGLVPSYNCSGLPWIRAASLFPTFFGTFCSLYVYNDFSRGRFLLNAPFMLLTLIQMPPVVGMLISQVLPGTVVYFIPLTAAEGLGMGLVLAISNTQAVKKKVQDVFERIRAGAPRDCLATVRERTLDYFKDFDRGACAWVIPYFFLFPVAFVYVYVASKVQLERVETEGADWKYFRVPLDVKMLLVPTVVFCQFTGETMVRLYLGEGWWQSMYFTWAERTWHEYSQHVFNTGITFQQSVQSIWLQIISAFCVGG